MSINFKSITVWNKLPADIRTSHSLNVFVDNLRNYFLSRYTEFITDVFFIFCDMLYLCVMYYQQYDNISSILVLSIVLSVRMPQNPLQLAIGPKCFDVKSFRNRSCFHSVNKLLCIVLKNCSNKIMFQCFNVLMHQYTVHWAWAVYQYRTLGVGRVLVPNVGHGKCISTVHWAWAGYQYRTLGGCKVLVPYIGRGQGISTGLFALSGYYCCTLGVSKVLTMNFWSIYKHGTISVLLEKTLQD